MYYLNDKHAKYEYAVYTRVNNACPYIAHTFNNKKAVEEWLKEIIKQHNRYHHTYYIDTKEYKNEYPKEIVQFYYKILQRPVNDWQETM
jgi:hypothetical protein